MKMAKKNSQHRFELLPPPTTTIKRHHPKQLCYREPAVQIEIRSRLYSRELVYRCRREIVSPREKCPPGQYSLVNIVPPDKMHYLVEIVPL